MTWELLLVALACSLEPLPLTAYILTVSTKAGARNGLAFIVGWVLTLAAVIVLTLALTSGQPLIARSAPSTAVLIAKVLLGLGLLAFAWRLHGRPPATAKEPSWMKRMDGMSVWSAAALAFLLQPWGLVAGAALWVTESDVGRASDLVVLAAFTALATVTYAAMQVYVVRSPEASRARLDGLRSWIEGHRTPMIIGISAVVGLLLIATSAATLLA